MTADTAPEVLAVIPARGGSKGVPRKNVRMLTGKPLIAHIIAQARRAESVCRVCVSTDDAEIADVAEACGAEVIERPAELSTDIAGSEQALIHALRHLADTESYSPDILVFLQCTSPLTTAEDIDKVVAALADQQADSALAVCDFHYFLWQLQVDGQAVGINHDSTRRLMRQQRQSQYVETGAVYAMKADGFLKAGHRFFGKIVCHVMPAERRLEIDEEADFRVAEVLLRNQQAALRQQALPQSVGAVLLDFDGVFTDNRVWVGRDGREAVACDRRDGYGLALLREAGIPLAVISTETNPVVAARCRKLQIECHQGVEDKPALMKQLLVDRHLDVANVIYVGNDLNDRECLQLAGCGVVPADAAPAVMPSANIVLDAPGGRGAIRELCDLILAARRSG